MLLKPKTMATTGALRVRVPADLLAQIEDVRKRAEARGLVLDVGAICADALRAAVRKAEHELGAQ